MEFMIYSLGMFCAGIFVGFGLRGLINHYLNRRTKGYKTIWGKNG